MSKSSIVKNSLWNFLGYIIPSLIGVITIPFTIKNIGVESMGILTLIWTCIGYFSLFDFGVGRALTFIVSDLIGKNKWSEIGFHIFAGLVLISLFGTLGSAIVYFAESSILRYFFNPSAELIDSTKISLIYMAISLPFVLLTTGIRGVLESFSAFKELNLVKILMGFFNFSSPFIVSLFTPKLDIIVLVLVVGRIFFSFYHFILLNNYLKNHSQFTNTPWFQRNHFSRFKIISSEVKSIFNFSGWMTVSNIIGPLMVYADRFLIAKFYTAAETAYYTVPFEAITKIWIIPIAITSVLFPAFAQEFAKTKNASTPEKANDYLLKTYEQSFKLFTFIFIPLILLIGFFSKEILQIWLGSEFVFRSTLVLIILGFAVICNCFGHVSFALIQGYGTSLITAVFHLIELPLYLIMVYFLTEKWGITGTALAWFLRIILDNFLLMGYVYFKIDRRFSKIHNRMTYFIGTTILIVTLLSNELLTPNLTIALFFTKTFVVCLSTFLLYYFFFQKWVNIQDISDLKQNIPSSLKQIQAISKCLNWLENKYQKNI